MLHAFGPRHFTDVNQAFDSLLEFNERSVVGDADDAAGNVCADRVAMLGIEPRIGRKLLEAERNALLVLVVFENFHLNLIADIDQIFGMREASPRHISDVQQAVETAEINECAILGKILNDASKACA